MSDQLKPCPFCGGSAQVTIGHSCSMYAISYITCVECGATGEKFANRSEYENSASIKAWNNRTGEIV